MYRVGSIIQFLEFVNKKDRIYLLGAGKDARTCYNELRKRGVFVEKFIDEDEKKWGGNVVNGVEVVSPDNTNIDFDKGIFLLCIGELSFYSDEYILQSSICRNIVDRKHIFVFDRSLMVYKKFIEDCNKRNIKLNESILDLGQMKLPNFLIEEEKIRKVFLTECNDLIMPPVFDDYSMIDEGTYEYGNVFVANDDIVIDCGANLGLFSAYAASKGAEVYSFEPISDTVELLKKTQQLYSNHIHIIQKAVSSVIQEVNMTNLDFFGQNRITRYDFDVDKTCVHSITIDRFVEENCLERVDFIKADIEGEEKNMILRAEKVLRKHMPKLAICTYHNADDPVVLEKLIRKVNPQYKVMHKYKKLYAYV